VSRVREVTLTPLTESDRDEFFQEQIADYADQQIRDAGWSPDDALTRARDEFTPVLELEFAEGIAAGDRLWSAHASRSGESVGWLWVKPVDGMPARGLYLEQITVAAACRRQGYGRAMLAALEDLLAGEGVEELRLHVYRGNRAAQGLYAAACYEELERNDVKIHLRKLLLVRSAVG
jgi:ribosomal protein S18 acetylase RimI-like enzyme